MSTTTLKPEVTRAGLLDMQVCIPSEWTDEQVKSFADTENPCGTMNGWQIRKDAESLNSNPERNPCSVRGGFVHVTLDA